MEGTNNRRKRVRDSEGRLEGIALLPPHVALIRESSFSKVKIYAGETGNGSQPLTRNSENVNNTYPKLVVIEQHTIHIFGRILRATEQLALPWLPME